MPYLTNQPGWRVLEFRYILFVVLNFGGDCRFQTNTEVRFRGGRYDYDWPAGRQKVGRHEAARTKMHHKDVMQFASKDARSCQTKLGNILVE